MIARQRGRKRRGGRISIVDVVVVRVNNHRSPGDTGGQDLPCLVLENGLS